MSSDSDSEDGSYSSDPDSGSEDALRDTTHQCVCLVSKESEIPTIWSSFAFLPNFYTVGRLPFQRTRFATVFDERGSRERIVSLRIDSIKSDAPKVLDLTPILVHLLNNSSLEKLEWRASDTHGLGRASYRVSLLCDALKTNQTLRSLKMYHPQPHHDPDLPASRRLIRDVVEDGNTTLQELNLHSYDPDQTLVSTDFNFQEPFKGNGYDCWAATLRGLNLNALGRKNLREGTLCVAEFVELLDPKKIMRLVDQSSRFMREVVGDKHEWCLEVGDASHSLKALSHNYNVLMTYLDDWSIMVYNDLRATDLIYGMLRESPGIWCYRESIKLRSPIESAKKRKLGD